MPDAEPLCNPPANLPTYPIEQALVDFKTRQSDIDCPSGIQLLKDNCVSHITYLTFEHLWKVIGNLKDKILLWFTFG